jgi:hypothetical protein
MLNAYGLGFSNEELAGADVQHGGHSNIRAVVDKLQADALERCMISY